MRILVTLAAAALLVPIAFSQATPAKPKPKITNDPTLAATPTAPPCELKAQDDFGGVIMCDNDKLAFENVLLKRKSAKDDYDKMTAQYRQAQTDMQNTQNIMVQKILKENPGYRLDTTGQFVKSSPADAKVVPEVKK